MDLFALFWKKRIPSSTVEGQKQDWIERAG